VSTPSSGSSGASPVHSNWSADVLGPPWQASTIALRPDGAGAPVATLVRRRAVRSAAGPSAPAVLYLHGFADYFFQADHGRAWAERGFDFYALDMRDHGRSIRPGRRPGWVPGIETHVEEVSAALHIIRTDGDAPAGDGRLDGEGSPGSSEVADGDAPADHETPGSPAEPTGGPAGRPVLLMGHSTGGLIACLYADRHPRAVAGLVLNSPWFDLHRPKPVRTLARPLIRTLGNVAPLLPVSALDDGYGRSLHSSTGGDFDYRLDWKPLDAFPIRAGWLASVLDAQRRVRRGLDILAPVLMCTSDASGHPTRPTAAQLAGTDVVLGVADMHRAAPRLGADVQVLQVSGGRHDLALSDEPARNFYTENILDWAEQKAAPSTRLR